MTRTTEGVDWSRVNKNEAARKIADEVQQRGWRTVADRTGISRGALEHLVYKEVRTHPRLSTIEKLAKYWTLPNWRVQEMFGIDVNLPGGDAGARKLAQLIESRPELAPLMEQLPHLTDDEVRAALAFLESLRRHRPEGRAGG